VNAIRHTGEDVRDWTEEARLKIDEPIEESGITVGVELCFMGKQIS
jgi:hypothetical protein